jgi:hypothetical protein
MQAAVPARRSKRAAARRGFTIVEVAMATMVMAFGIATAIIALQSGFKTLDVARGTTLASQILQSEMERIRLMSWGEVNALNKKEIVDLSKVFIADPAVANRFELVRVIEDVSGMEGEMVQISLIVGWKSVDGRPLSRTFQTVYAKNGLYDYYYTLARP